MYTFYTKSLQDDRRVQLLTIHNYLSFKVQACDTAHLYLHSDPEKPNEQNYEIQIGDQTSILKDGTKMKSSSTQGILDCSTYKEFWLTFGHWGSSEAIVLGSGSTFGEGEILNWRDSGSVYDVTTITLATSGDKEGLWKVHRSLGRITIRHLL